MTNNPLLKEVSTSKKQRYVKKLQTYNDLGGSGYLAGLFTLSSNVDGIEAFLRMTGQYLFFIAFGLKAADFGFALLDYLTTHNRNLTKTSNLLIKGVVTGLVGLATFGLTVLSSATLGLVFAISVAIELGTSLVAMVYHGLQSVRTQDPTRKAFFYHRCKEQGTKSLITLGIITGAVAVMILIPHLAPILLLVGAGITLAAIALDVGLKLKKRRLEAAQMDLPPTTTESPLHFQQQAHVVETLQVNPNPVAPAVAHPKAEDAAALCAVLKPAKKGKLFNISGFFDNKIKLEQPLPAAIQGRHIIAAIDQYAEKYYQAKLPVAAPLSVFTSQHIAIRPQPLDATTRWTKSTKAKVDSLYCLKQLLQGLEMNKYATEKQISFSYFTPTQQSAWHTITYQNSTDLIKQFDAFIRRTYPNALQSFLHEVGGVEFLLKQSYRYIERELNLPPPTQALEAEPSKPHPE